ncbi:MAG TPA: hypothetical protein VMT10_08635 [Solirubrobacteraceae bacterium]|nr:hypothetical protein [Solirubrobacteraceae bacterium]
MRISRRPSRAALLSALALAAPAIQPVGARAAQPGFGRPIAVQAPSLRSSGEPVASVSAAGDVIVAWDQQLSARAVGVLVRRGTTAGRFARAQAVTTAGYEPAVAAGAGGGAAVVWQTDARGGTRHVQVAVAQGSHRFGRAQTLATARANITSQTVLYAGGRYVALWWQGVPGTGRHAVRYALSDAHGRFGAAGTLASDTGPASGVSAAAAPDGTLIATWGTALGGTVATNQQLAYAQLAPGAPAFGPARQISAVAAASGASAGGMTVAAGPGGAALGWTESGQLPELLRAAPLTPAVSAPETVLSLDSSDLGKRWATGPALALPGGGQAPVAAWAVLQGPGGESEAITGGSVFAARRSAAGSYPAPAQLSAPATIATLPVAGATSSDAVVAWATGQFPRYGLQYALANGGAAFSPARSLTAGNAERGVSLASSPGAVVAVWVSRPGPAGTHPRGVLRGVSIAILRAP